MAVLWWALAALLLLVGCPRPPVRLPPPPPPTRPEPTPEPMPEATPLGRLPLDVRPTRYQLRQTIIPAREGFEGDISIALELGGARRVLWLHGADLEVDQVRYQPEGAAAIAGRYEQVDKGGVARITLDALAPVGTGTLHMHFRGKFSTRHNGLYRVNVGKDHYAFTQFEPVWTRYAFPCFDEPAVKVPWDVTLTVSKDDRVVANTREVSREDAGNGLTRVTFAPTEPLPSYLIAFAVGPLDIVEAPPIAATAVRQQPLPFRGVAARGRGKEMAYALEHTPALLKILEDYFGIPYPYDKLDIIAVPDKGGAMENAGAVTFREWLVLVDDKTASIDQRRAFGYVMAHELAHQWFGNLVTMPWWDDIWLNEAFATWMGYLAVEKWRPTQQALVSQLKGVHRAMSVDSLLSARQIRQPVHNNNDIHNAFDAITYRKGGGVLGMFESYLGPKVFRTGLQSYMTKHRHGSATADDLLQAFSVAANKDVKGAFESFLLQPGLPVVSAEVACDADGVRVKLTQQRYLPLGSTGGAKQTWRVPVCVRYGDSAKAQRACTLMTGAEQTLKLSGAACPQWLMPNADAAGYYVWALSAADWRKLGGGMKHMSVRERMSVVRSVQASFRAGRMTAAQALMVLGPLAKDPHPAVASGAIPLLMRLDEWFEAGPERDKLRRYARKLYAEPARKLGFAARKGDSPETQLLRRSVVALMTQLVHDKQWRGRVLRKARKYIGADGDRQIHREVLDANLASVAMAVLGQEADEKTFALLLELLGKATDDTLRRQLVTALAHVEAAPLRARTLALTLEPTLRLTEMTMPLYVQMSEPASRQDTWAFLENNIGALIKRLPPRRAGWLPSVATSFCSDADAKRVSAFFEPWMKTLAGGPREVKLAAERIGLCAKLKAQQLPAARTHFKAMR